MPTISSLELARNRREHFTGAKSAAPAAARNLPEVVRERREALEIDEAIKRADVDGKSNGALEAKRDLSVIETAAGASRRNAQIDRQYQPIADADDEKKLAAKRMLDKSTALLQESIRKHNISVDTCNRTASCLTDFRPDEEIRIAKVSKGSSIVEDIDPQMSEVEGASQRREDLIAYYIAEVDKVGAEARPHVYMGKSPSIEWPVVKVSADPDSRMVGVLPVAPNANAWACRFHRDEIIADIQAQVTEKYKTVQLELSDDERRARLADLKAQRLAADRRRCEKIWDDFHKGVTSTLDFPRDADPLAILGIEPPKSRRRG